MAKQLLFVLLVALSGYFGIGDARAVSLPITANSCTSFEEACTMSQAYQAASQQCAAYGATCGSIATGSDRFRILDKSGNLLQNRLFTAGCPAGTVWSDVTHSCRNPCDGDAPALGSGSWVASANSSPVMSAVCNGGCQFAPPQGTLITYKVVDGIAYTNLSGYTPVAAVCATGQSSSDGVLPPSDSDGDGVSDGNDAAPFNPGIGGNQPPTPPPPPPGTCGGAGQPVCPNDPASQNHSSGGATCDSPPSSSGDETLAQIAFQAWATRCAVVKNANDKPSAPTTAPAVDLTPLAALQAATNDKLEALKTLASAEAALMASQSTASKQDDQLAMTALSKAATEATKASIDVMDAHNALIASQTSTQMAAIDAHRTAEIGETNSKIQAFKDANKDSIDATNAAIERLRLIMDDAAATTNNSIAALNGVTVGASATAHSDSVAHKASTDTAKDQAHADALDLKAAIAALNSTVNVNVDSSGTESRLDTANTSLSALIAKAQAEVDAQGQGNGFLANIQSAVDKLLAGFGFEGPVDPLRPALPAEDLTAADVVTDVTSDGAALDTNGWGLSQSCPTIPPFQFMGTSIEFDTSPVCGVFGALRYILLLLASIWSLRIMADMPGLPSE
jgi:hypothetical protein